MNLAVGLLGSMVIVWGILTGVVALLLIYRSVVGQHKEDHLFLDAAEQHLAQEQKEVLRRVEKVGPYLYVFGAASAVLLLLIFGIWLWEGIKTAH